MVECVLIYDIIKDNTYLLYASVRAFKNLSTHDTAKSYIDQSSFQ